MQDQLDNAVVDGAANTPLSFGRRQILKSLGATALLSVMPSAFATLVTAGDQINAAKPFRVIYDQRHPEAIAFAKQAVRQGHTVRAISGDPTAVWYNELWGKWKESPATVVGLTRQDTLFVMERLAWDAGLQVVSRQVDPKTHLVSWIIAKKSTV